MASTPSTRRQLDGLPVCSLTARFSQHGRVLAEKGLREELSARPTHCFISTQAPKIEAPKFDIPKFDAPKVDAPSFSAPKFDAPAAPKMDMPKFDAPKFDAPSMPSFSAPSMPKISAPSAPSFSAPSSFDSPRASFDIPKDQGLEEKYKNRPELLVPQEDRDAAAASANDVYKQYEQDARAAEKAARDARDDANKKKKEFQAKKDLACETRPGGKWVCLRGFGAGF